MNKKTNTPVNSTKKNKTSKKKQKKTDKVELTENDEIDAISESSEVELSKTDLSKAKLLNSETLTQKSSEQGIIMSNETEEHLNQMLAQAAKSSQTAMMMVDRDLSINFMNQATLDLLNSLEPVMRSIWKDFKATEEFMMGKCIDDFHKNPSHQRKLLSDPNNLPYKTNISLGDSSIELNVAAVMDADNNYIGSSLEWSDITEQIVNQNAVARMQGAMAGSATATMMVDRDLLITYMNPATMDLLKTLEPVLKSIWTDFKATEDFMLGKCIDDFHANPAHQRKILDDPSNMPYQANIKLGDNTVALNVAAIMDGNGEYVGSSLEWADVTAKVAADDVIARMQGAMTGSATATMMVDRDLLITYMNPATMDLLKTLEPTLKSIWKDFKATEDFMLGKCIDDFHANPAHQRKILDDPGNMPYQANIKLGDNTVALNVTAIMDANGNYVGSGLEWSDVTELKEKEVLNNDFAGQIAAISMAQAVIEFNMDGSIINANENFLTTLGYTLEEIQGKHHSMFVDPTYKASAEYREFWEKLNRGEFEAQEYKRFGKGGKEVWIQASYNPILDLNGKPFKVVKYATDVSAAKLATANYEGQVEAISKAQAVIEFNMDGSIISANENFLATLGYTLEEIQGKHHSMFVDPTYKTSAEYREFWEKLNRGEYEAQEYKRFGKGGKEVWIQASYNPILDLNGKPFKVVKYATDVTAAKLETANYEGQVEAINKAQAVIEFNMDGTIVDANENFLSVMGYRLDEVEGHHHSMFVEPKYKSSVEYKEFWEKLNRGEYQAGDYLRIDKNGKEVWIKASYNPIMDLNGNPFKVVKYATDITAQMVALARIDELVQGASLGKLSDRIDTSKSEGFIVSLGEGINKMLDTIVAPITACQATMSEMATGSLQQNMEGEYHGTFKELQTAVNTTIDNLRNMVGEIMEASSHVSTSSREISQGNTDLSQRTEEQASSLEETASSMEELTATVKENSGAANKANRLSETTMQQAASGGKVVEEAIVAMKEINNASREISDIIGVIDEIAFQTNLLALNAAVEAARAGDQGRGFAVVAAEVRNLAQRSASAAKDIKSLISNSVDKVNQGTELVNDSGEKLAEIVESVRNVSGLVNEIANASEEQASGIEEVNQAVTQMDTMTQQNSALVEEAAAAAEALTEQAGNMLELMSFFKTGEESGVKGGKIVSPIKQATDKSKTKVVEEDWEEF